MGCAIARALALRGVRCTVIDPRPAGGGATQASAGMLAPYVEAHAGGPMLDLSVRSLERYDDWIADLRAESWPIDYERIGTLEIALDPEAAHALRQRQDGWLEPPEVAAMVEPLAPTAGALWDGRHGYVDARQLTAALAQSAERHGARFVAARVDRVDRTVSGFRLGTGPDDTDRIEAGTIVLAAGAWTNRIHGIPTPPLRPVRGQLLHFAWTGAPIRTILWGPDCYIVPRPSGGARLLVGATVEEAGFDERATDEGIRGLMDAARALLPGLRPEALIETRVGLRPATPDELPVLGRDPQVPGLVHASGHYRNGVLLAPITGDLIADLVQHDRSDPILDSFRPERF